MSGWSLPQWQSSFLLFASVISLRTFETPLRRYLTEAYDRRAIGPSHLPPISRQEGA